MARKISIEEQTSTVSDNHALSPYQSLEQYSKEKRRSKRPSVVLCALVSLFLSSAGGVILAIVLILQPTEVPAICIARDLILFAAGISLLYICLHVRGARKNIIRKGSGPPQVYGNCLHASALLVARLCIAMWVAALVATAIIIAKAAPSDGLVKMAPYLDLVICIGAIPSFVAISSTIESNPTPFATTGLSKSSFLSGHILESTDQLTADLSVSRRASLQRKESSSASIVTLPTAEIFRLGNSKEKETETAGIGTDPLMIRTESLPNDRAELELMANSPIGVTHFGNNARFSAVPPTSSLPSSLSKPPPQPVYSPGAWRSEWDNTIEQAGAQKAAESFADGSGANHPAYISSTYSSTSDSSSHTPISSKPSVRTITGHRVTPSTSIASSANRSRLSTVRYASEPEVAIRQAIRVIKNPNYSPALVSIGKVRETIKPPEPVVVPISTHRAQDIDEETLRHIPSNFSRPLPSPPEPETDSAIGMGISGTFDNELPGK